MGGRLEVPVLIEDIVGGQKAFLRHHLGLAFLQKKSGVVQRPTRFLAIFFNSAQQERNRSDLFCERPQSRIVLLQKILTME